MAGAQIDITSQGCVCFIPDGWGRRVSNKHLEYNCKLLDDFIPGDTALADQEFDIKDSVRLYCKKMHELILQAGKETITWH